MKNGLFTDSGVPGFDVLEEKLNLLRKLVQEEKKADHGKLGSKSDNLFTDGNVVYLPGKGKAIFAGDIHGDLEAMVSIVIQSNLFEAVETKTEAPFLVFLGDYADRGKKDVETINEILSLKLNYPENVVLLRGNHEELDIGSYYGGLDSMMKYYGPVNGERLFRLYAEVMAALPVVAVTANRIIGVHGGIPNQDIASLKSLNDPQRRDLLYQMIWNDPSNYISEREPSSRGDVITSFGKDAFDRFMDKVRADVMVRSHQYPVNGVNLMFGARLATIFSNGSKRSISSGYTDRVNRAVFLEVRLDEPKQSFEESDFTEVTYVTS